jgi:hypothetical protein
MKERRLLGVTVLMVAFLLVSSSAVAAQPSGSRAIECVLDITYNVWPEESYWGSGEYWSGTVTGPGCSIEGPIKFEAVEDEYFYPRGTMHFVEVFTIHPDSGGEIHGKDWGVWNYSTFKFRANGWITEASDEWAHLVGSRYHEIGWTSSLDDGLPLTTSDGQMHIAPSDRP